MARFFSVALVTTAAWLAPLAAASEDCRPEYHHDLRYYLLTDDAGRLVMSEKAPSARNESTWSATVPLDGNESKATVHLHFPGANHVLSERHGPEGALKVSVERLGPVDGLPAPPSYSGLGNPVVEVRLVEGNRSVSLGRGGASASERTVELHGDYPGHGKKGAPHTHGDGSDPERGLELKDLDVEIEFRIENYHPALPTAARYRFDVHIDGRTFLEISSDARLDEEGDVDEMYYEEGQSARTWEAHDYETDISELPAPSLLAASAAVGGLAFAVRRRRG